MATTGSTEDPNRHIKEYLKYYIALAHPPHYAVLIDGPWGIGEAFLVETFLDELFVRQDNAYTYISLYGLTSQENLDNALLQGLYPFLGWKGTKIAGRMAKTVLKLGGFDASGIDIRDFLNKYKPQVLVFDDLERCEMPINKVMGYINDFVEHQDCKVVIIANEKELGGSPRQPKIGRFRTNDRRRGEYARRREKLVGKTLQVQSAFEEAMSFFTSKISGRRCAESHQLRETGHCRDLQFVRIVQPTHSAADNVGFRAATVSPFR